MIEFKNINLKYENRQILKNLNFKVKPKQRVVIKGPSGSGKTTILRLIAGFETPDSGEIYIDKKLVTQNDKIIIPPHKRELSMVFQDLALWPHMNVEENITFGLKINKTAKKQRIQKVKQILELVNLTGYENKKIDQLSGGEQQRVALARALILSPKILLMDEPLSSLDEKLNIKLRGEIISLQKELGFTLVYVTHNQKEADEIGQRVIPTLLFFSI